MESEEKFTEGITSYGRRLATELELLTSNVERLAIEKSSPLTARYLLQYVRKSLNKINSYVHNIEILVEKECAKGDTNINQNALRSVVSGGEDIKT